MYVSELIVSPLVITSTRITPLVSQKTVIVIFPTEGVIFNFFFFLVIADDTTPLAQKKFHLLGPLKDALRGSRFEDDEIVIRAVRTWLREQETSWYREGVHAPVSRWRKAVDVDGDYVEK